MRQPLSHFRIRLRGQMGRARREGVIATSQRIATAMAYVATWVCFLPITIVGHLAGYRRLTVIGERVGHLAAEVDCFLKKRDLGEIRARRYFLAIPVDRVANSHLLCYWSQHLPVVSHPWLARLLVAMSGFILMREDVGQYVLRLNKTQEIYRVNATWNGRPPILRLTQEDKEWGRKRLRDIGLPEQAWFVCIHVRSSGFSPHDDAAHAYRNAHIEAMLAAIREIAKHGGWSVRMGDPSMPPLPPCENVVDYAHHSLRSARLDVVLAASCRFFFGNSSGVAFIATVFGVPSALANMIPCSVLGVLPVDISIPKLLWDKKEARYLTFGEIMASPTANYRYTELYERAGIGVEENSAEDLASLVLEMLAHVEGRHKDEVYDRELQRRFKALLRVGHYSYGSVASVASGFLRRHEALIS